MTEARTYTFWQLIQDQQIERIEIPIIQRDYAQGRQTKDIQQVRESFLNVLFKSLAMKDKIELDFVYGTVNMQGVFTPLDGQQRLTTLYLLHWYSAMREGRMGEACNVLSRFSYETRSSSKAFCRMLVQLEDITFDKATISEEIQNASNFFLAWKHDPTVQAMLVMLDAIHDLYKEALYDTLTNDCPIQFKFIDLKMFQLEDTLYIKMNARGKPLTPFENFKAKLQSYMEQLVKQNKITSDFSKNFLLKMDNQWADFFWTHQKESYNQAYLQLIQVIIINQLALHRGNTELVSMLISQERAVSFDEIVKAQLDNEAWLCNLEITVDSFIEKVQSHIPRTIIDAEQLVRRSMSPEITYTDRLRLFAFTAYVSEVQVIDEETFSTWMRFIRNVTENTLYNAVTDYINSVHAIQQLVSLVNDFNTYLTKSTTKLQGFYGAQLEQEKKKAQLMLSHAGWKSLLEKAEDYPYFKGDIGFLLDFAGVTSVKEVSEWDDAVHVTAQKQFVFYYERAIAIFGSEKLKVDKNLFTRALLTFGDYTLKKGRNYSFLTEGFDRDISWKRLLREDNASYLKDLFDALDMSNVEISLQSIIEGSDAEDWRRYFIKYPLILNETCGSKRFIRYNDENRILLLERSATNGYCQEYYSYALYAALQEKNIESVYNHSLGRHGEKYVKVLKLGWSISFEEGKFIWRNDNNQEWESKSLENVVSELEKELNMLKI